MPNRSWTFLGAHDTTDWRTLKDDILKTIVEKGGATSAKGPSESRNDGTQIEPLGSGAEDRAAGDWSC
jgi:hypothetical protein